MESNKDIAAGPGLRIGSGRQFYFTSNPGCHRPSDCKGRRHRMGTGLVKRWPWVFALAVTVRSCNHEARNETTGLSMNHTLRPVAESFCRVIAFCGIALVANPVSAASVSPSPDEAESGSMEAIANFTSEPRFLSPWVAYVPTSTTVPSPTSFLGHLVGAPGELTRSAKIVEYVRKIAGASPRVHVETIGMSEEGRDIVLVAIADEVGIKNLDQLKVASAALADPRKTSPEQAEGIIADARPAYYFNCNIHADETGSGEMCMELIYRLAVSEQPMIKAIRENLLVLVNPVSATRWWIGSTST
jgi:hypothetical protein